MIDPQLEGKVAIITGANHGIGAATAVSLAAQGVRVFITYHLVEHPFSDEELDEARRAGVGGARLYIARQQQPGAAVAEAIRADGGTAVAYPLDLGQTENIGRLFELCEAELGPADILIINHTHFQADTFDPAAVSDRFLGVSLVDADIADRHLAVNARASALLMRAYIERHIAQGAGWGRIVTLTTSLRHAGSVSYAASKSALVSYSLSAAAEFGQYGVTVNVVCPGPTQTGYITPENAAWIVPKTPLGRLGLAEDVADVITFLASEQGGWLTGQLLYAGGGFSMFLTEG